MRELTESEKRFCETLLENDKKYRGLKPLGDVVLKYFGIDYIKKDQFLGQNEKTPFNVRIGVRIEKKDEVIQNVNEVIALLLLLEKEGMISYIPIETNRIIGEESLLMDCSPKPIKGEYGFLDCFGVNTWSLLNSYYYLTNSFKDFVNHKFRTIEARRHKQIMTASWTAIIVAILTSIVSIYYSVHNKQIEVIDLQFDNKRKLIKEIVNQNDSIIRLINDFNEDSTKAKKRFCTHTN